MQYAEHPLAAIFPAMRPEEYEALKGDIARNGLRVPLTLYEGMVLDGRHRARACGELGIIPQTAEYAGSDPMAYIISANLHRRHLSTSQRAMIAAGLANMPLGGATYRSAILPTDAISQSDAAALLNVSERSVRGAKTVLEDAPELAEQIRTGDLTVEDAKRQLSERKREQVRAANRALVEQVPVLDSVPIPRCPAIVLDPPWDWGDEGDQDQFGRARPTYATMTIDEIAALPVADLATDNAHLYLWITNRSLPKGFGLLEAWGFRYVTALTWCKPSIGMGNYFRGSTEHILFGVRGSMPLLRRDIGTWFQADRPGKHSAKPEAFYRLVEECSPGPWLELFQRTPRQGWYGWGAEVGDGTV